MFSKNSQDDIYDSYGEDSDETFSQETLQLESPEEQLIAVKKNKHGHWVVVYEDMYGPSFYKDEEIVDDEFFELNIDQLRVRIFNGQKNNIDVSQDKHALFLIEENEAYEENEKRRQNV